jgi:hypothetical protein
MLDNYKEKLYDYLDNMIINKFYEHKYVHIYLTTGFGKNRLILKYIDDNKDKKIGIFTNGLSYDMLIEDYKNVKNIDNVQYLSIIKFFKL